MAIKTKVQIERRFYYLKWKEAYACRCIGCGGKCFPGASRCRVCESKHRGKEHKCKDCAIPINRHSFRCRSCASKLKLTTRGGIVYKRLDGHSANWKGGRVNRNGYKGIWNPKHPRATKAGYVLEHVLVWEQITGEPLPKGWHIHHLNGIKDDNNPRNLVALPSKKHYLVLQAKAKRIQELEARLNGQSQLL